MKNAFIFVVSCSCVPLLLRWYRKHSGKLGVIRKRTKLPNDSRSAQASAKNTTAHCGETGDLIRDGAGIQELVSVLREGCEEARALAAARLHTLAEEPANQAAIQSAGGIRLLIELLSEGPIFTPRYYAEPARAAKPGSRRGRQEAQEEAAAALWKLARTAKNRDVIREEGGIPALVRLLTEGSKAAQTYSGNALVNLASNEENKNAIRDAGGLKTMIELLREGSKDTHENALLGLANLARNDVNVDEIRKLGGLRVLVTLLREGTHSELETILFILTHLMANNAKNKDATCAEGGIPPIIKILADGSAEGKAYAALCLQGLAWSNETRELIRNEGGIPPLIKGLQACAIGKPTARLLKADVSGADLTAMGCAAALGNLAIESASRDVIREEGGIPPLIELLREGNAELQDKAAAALRNLAMNAQNCDVISEEGGVEALQDLLEEDISASTKEHVGHALRKLGLQVEGASSEFETEEEEEQETYDFQLAAVEQRQEQLESDMVPLLLGVASCLAVLAYFHSRRWLPSETVQPLLVA